MTTGNNGRLFTIAFDVDLMRAIEAGAANTATKVSR